MPKKQSIPRRMKKNTTSGPPAGASTPGVEAANKVRMQMAAFTDEQRSALHKMWKDVFLPMSKEPCLK